MPNYPIKLGKKSESLPEPCCPTNYFPSLYLDWEKSYDLPESGEMVVRFVKTSETNSKSKHGERQSVTLEIKEIVSVEADEDEDEESSEDAIDRLAKESEEEGDDE